MTSKMRLFLVLTILAGLLMCENVSAQIKDISPAAACNALSRMGLPTLGWRTYIDDECGCSSRAKVLGKGNPFPNSLAYFVDGKGQRVVQLRLIVNVLNPDETDVAHGEFKQAAQFLIMKITSKPAPESIFRAMENKVNMVYREGSFSIEISRKDWTMNTDWATFPCHEIRLIIR